MKVKYIKLFKGILSVCILLFILIKFIHFYQSDMSQMVLPAVSMNDAKRMEKEGQCYIVYQSKDSDRLATATYYLKDDVKREIRLIGNTPYNELSYVFMTSCRNRFLVKGYIHEDLSDHVGSEVFYVESWNFIKPIIREYGQKDYRPEQRFFYPLNYLDEYDMRSKDYIPLIHYDIFMSGLESEYYLGQKGYYKITPWWNGISLEWFIEQEENELKVTLEGCSPEYVLNNNILYNERDGKPVDEIYGNSFIANGLLKKDKEGECVLEIYKWWLNIPYSHNDYSIKGSGSNFGFNDSDIQAGIYKNYK